VRQVYPAISNPRCPHCGVHLALCFCADYPVFATRTRTIFLQHSQELVKPTNSARLACRILSNASIRTWERLSPPEFGPEAILLFPFPGSPALEPGDMQGNAVIVIPDGTWSQAGRMANVLNRTGSIRSRTLPPGESSLWSVRLSNDPARISSAQAASAALAIGGESQAAEFLDRALVEASQKILAMRGILERMQRQ